MALATLRSNVMGQDPFLVFCVPSEIPTAKYYSEQRSFGFFCIAMCCAMFAEVLQLRCPVFKIINP